MNFDTIFIENRSRLFEPTVVMAKKGSGGPVLESEHKRNKADRYYVLDLDPGEYHLTIKQHPEWDCTLVINAR